MTRNIRGWRRDTLRELRGYDIEGLLIIMQGLHDAKHLQATQDYTGDTAKQAYKLVYNKIDRYIKLGLNLAWTYDIGTSIRDNYEAYYYRVQRQFYAIVR